MEKDDKILLTGHTGLLGKAIAKSFDEKGFKKTSLKYLRMILI